MKNQSVLCRTHTRYATLYLGDCAELLPEIGAIDALVTDPPYLINTSGSGKYRKQRRTMERITEAGIDKGFDIGRIDFSLYKTAVFFCHNDQIPIISPVLFDSFHRCVQLDWRKTNPQPFANRNYRPDKEIYFHAWNKKSHPSGSLSDLARSINAPVGKSPYDHPTVKPDKVMDKIITNVNGDTVIDPFMGTGSTGVAAIRQGKKFIGIEKDSAFFNIAVARFYELCAEEVRRTLTLRQTCDRRVFFTDQLNNDPAYTSTNSMIGHRIAKGVVWKMVKNGNVCKITFVRNL